MDFSDAFSAKDPLAKDIQSILEATDKLRHDIMGYLYIHNKSEYQDIADFLNTGTREVAQIARELEREGLVKTSTTWMVLTPKGKKSLTEESIEEASVGDKHQKKIAIDTVKNPMKGKLLGGMTEKEAIELLKKKFGYSDAQIKKLQKEEVTEARIRRKDTPQRYFGEDSDFIYIAATDRAMAIKYLDREQVTYRIWGTRRAYAIEVAESDLPMIKADFQKIGIRITKPVEIIVPPIDGDKAARTLIGEALSLNQMNKIDSLLYAIMTDDKSKMNDYRSRSGNPPKGLLKNVMSNLRRNFKDVSDRELPIVLDMAIKNGYVRQDGDVLHMTPRAVEYIRYMES